MGVDKLNGLLKSVLLHTGIIGEDEKSIDKGLNILVDGDIGM